jgi:hypothetical protein
VSAPLGIAIVAVVTAFAWLINARYLFPPWLRAIRAKHQEIRALLSQWRSAPVAASPEALPATAPISRRYQILPAYGYCRSGDWDYWLDDAGTLELAALAHVRRTSHEVRLPRRQEIILRPETDRTSERRPA